MVQNISDKVRGRPRAYDRPTALKSMREPFWEKGFSGTSLDDLSAATAMNRPSLYNAFGDKSAAFKAVLEDYIAETRTLYGAAFSADVPLREGLRRVYDAAVQIYAREDGMGRGCFMVSAALMDSLRDHAIAETVLKFLHELDRAFRRRLKIAQQKGELSPNADIDALATLAITLHSTLSVRMRAGEDMATLRKFIDQTIGVICG
jgi:TetR/AcrR family transcriptional regulator, copper-responsive repressor